MLIITDISGATEALTGYTALKRHRNVSGEKTLAFLVLPTSQNAHSFPMVQEESIVEFDGEPFRIKQVSEKPKGATYYKEVVAVHTFFDLIDDYIYGTYTGSKTFDAALHYVLDGTAYTWDIVDTFLAQDWENFGDDNRLALFQSVLKRYGAEFTLAGTRLTFRTKIGNASDYQFRYNYNVKTLNRDVNTNNLSTYIKGYGKQNEDGTYVVESEYTSPNSAVFGIRHAKPVRDERYTTLAGLNARLQAEIIDEPELSITIDFADMRRAGFPYDVPNEGDDVFLIYEPIGIDVEARIMEIDEEFTEASDLPIKTSVTLANFRNNLTDTFVDFSKTQKAVNNAIDPSGKVRYNVLDDAVKRATEALQSAQTELEFTNGIIARDKTNPNFLVLLNSAGIGISKDGGATFKEAITSDGFVLSAGAIGQLSANNIQIGAATAYESGYDPSVLQGDGEFKVNTKQLILNSTFETGSDGKGNWSSWKDSWTNTKLGGTSRLFEGKNTAKFTVSGLTADEWREIKTNRVKSESGKVYTLSVWSRVDDLTTFDNGFSAEFEWYDSTGARIKADSLSILPSTNATWERKNVTKTAPTGTVEMNVRFHPNRNGVGWVAKPMLTEGTLVVPHSEASDAANMVRDDLKMAAPLPTSLTMNQDGITASTSDPTRYARLDYRGLYVENGAVVVKRKDGFVTIIDGMVNQSFDIQGSEPPGIVDVNIVGRFFSSSGTVTAENGGTCNIYTFTRTARYVVFQVAIMSSVQNAQSSVILVQSGNESVWLANVYTLNATEEVKTFYVDLGTPDGSVFALKMMLKSLQSDNTAYCRKIRAYQTDFLPS